MILGVVLVALGLTLIFERAYMISVIKELLDNKALLFFASFINIIFGLFILTVEHTISFSLVGLFALTGWLIFLRGICLLWFPEELVRFARKMLKNTELPVYASLVHLAWGVLLLSLAYSLI